MESLDWSQRRERESWSRDRLEQHQLLRLRWLLNEILPTNRLYAEKLPADAAELAGLDQLRQWPFTTKNELLRDDSPLAANLTYSIDRYTRMHRTSGTRGRPLTVLDTADDWQWWIETWQYVLDEAEITSADRALMAFSYGPFIGFWSAHDAVASRGALVVPAGGMSSQARLEMLRSIEATVVFCTPSYALHLAELAYQSQFDLSRGSATRIVVAGEPGGSTPSTRLRIEQAWGARVIDHSGATEIGPWGYADRQGQGLHVNEAEFLAEFCAIDSGKPAAEGELSELVLTSLGRRGCPVIRYRTGDLARPSWHRSASNRFVWLNGGVLGRVDDMMIVRGVNIFPSSVEQILREFPEVQEFRLTAFKSGQLDALRIEVEDALQQPRRIAEAMQVRLGLQVAVVDVPLNSLPRFEGKGKRFVDLRTGE